MRITKRQLKRIIREEYSKLKKAGLIREAIAMPPKSIEDQVYAIAEDDVYEELGYGASIPSNATQKFRDLYDDAYHHIEAMIERNESDDGTPGYLRSSEPSYDDYYDPSWGDSPRDYID